MGNPERLTISCPLRWKGNLKMKDAQRHEFASLDVFFDDCVALTCTDPELLGWISSKIQEFFPICEVISSKDPAGEVYEVVFRDLRRERQQKEQALSETKWWIIKQLCHQGWEPTRDESRSMAFKKRP
jgi:hypothetical protein